MLNEMWYLAKEIGTATFIQYEHKVPVPTPK